MKRDCRIPWFGSSKIHAHANFRRLERILAGAYGSSGICVDVPARVSVVKEHPFRAFEAMPALSESLGLFVVKVGAVIPGRGNASTSVEAVVVAFCTRSGKALALLDGNAITHLKCAAVSAMVTDRCAAIDAETLAIIGTGVQAKLQLKSVLCVRKLKEIRVFSPNPDRRVAFAREMEGEAGGARLRICASAEEACRGAQIISTATTSVMPVIEFPWIEGDSWHINCVGNHLPESREIPLALFEGATVFVEDLETAVAEAGESHRDARSLHDLIAMPPAPLRCGKTIFASTGHALLDLLAVHYVLQEAGVV